MNPAVSLHGGPALGVVPSRAAPGAPTFVIRHWGRIIIAGQYSSRARPRDQSRPALFASAIEMAARIRIWAGMKTAGSVSFLCTLFQHSPKSESVAHFLFSYSPFVARPVHGLSSSERIKACPEIRSPNSEIVVPRVQ